MSSSKQHFKLFDQLQTTHTQTRTHSQFTHSNTLTIYTVTENRGKYIKLWGGLRPIKSFPVFSFVRFWLKSFEHDKCSTSKCKLSVTFFESKSSSIFRSNKRFAALFPSPNVSIYSNGKLCQILATNVACRSGKMRVNTNRVSLADVLSWEWCCIQNVKLTSWACIRTVVILSFLTEFQWKKTNKLNKYLALR